MSSQTSGPLASCTLAAWFIVFSLFHELHLLEHGAPGQTIGVGERLEQFEVVVARADDQLGLLAGGLHRRGEVARLALELRRLAGADGENERRVQTVEITLAAQLVRTMASVNFT